MPEAATRRQRLRAQTEAEIKQRAWVAMAESGADALSLREIARQMGMAPSSLYNYFTSRDELLTALIVDAHRSLAAAVAAEYEARAGAHATAQDLFVAVGHAYRRWAMAHRTEWALIFSTSIPHYNGTPATKAAAQLATGVLLRITADALAAGAIDVARIDATLDPAMRTDLQRWSEEMNLDLPPAALAGSLWCYATMHGAISLDLNDQLPPPVQDNPAMFESALRAIFAQLG